MENKKTEKKRIFSKLTVCVAALALVSCAFVGGTFARYTTGQTEANGGANIADWYIDVMDGSDSTDVVFTISPYHIEWGEGATTGPRKNEITGSQTSLKVINKGEVSADVEITLGSEIVVINKTINDKGELVEGVELEAGKSYTDRAGNEYTWTGNATDGFYPNFTAKGENVSNENFNALKTAWAEMKLYKSDDTGIIVIGDLDVEAYTSEGNAVDSVTQAGKHIFTLGTDAYVVVTVDGATWTSDTATAEDGDNGDIRDTWIGENIAKVGYTLTWSADQSSTDQKGDVTGGKTPPAP